MVRGPHQHTCQATQAQGPHSRPSHADQGCSPGTGAGGSSGTSAQWASRAATVSTPFKCSFATCVGTRGVGVVLRVKQPCSAVSGAAAVSDSPHGSAAPWLRRQRTAGGSRGCGMAARLPSAQGLHAGLSEAWAVLALRPDPPAVGCGWVGTPARTAEVCEHAKGAQEVHHGEAVELLAHGLGRAGSDHHDDRAEPLTDEARVVHRLSVKRPPGLQHSACGRSQGQVPCRGPAIALQRPGAACRRGGCQAGGAAGRAPCCAVVREPRLALGGALCLDCVTCADSSPPLARHVPRAGLAKPHGASIVVSCGAPGHRKLPQLRQVRRIAFRAGRGVRGGGTVAPHGLQRRRQARGGRAAAGRGGGLGAMAGAGAGAGRCGTGGGGGPGSVRVCGGRYPSTCGSLGGNPGYAVQDVPSPSPEPPPVTSPPLTGAPGGTCCQAALLPPRGKPGEQPGMVAGTHGHGRPRADARRRT